MLSGGIKAPRATNFDLAADQGAALLAEIDAACPILAEKMVHDLFISTEAEEILDRAPAAGEA